MTFDQVEIGCAFRTFVYNIILAMKQNKRARRDVRNNERAVYTETEDERATFSREVVLLQER